MSDFAIRIEKVSKQFRIGSYRASYRTFRETVTDALMAPFLALGRALKGQPNPAKAASDIFWALKDVSFEVKPGEAVALIGQNGAGKSTLLKILSRITEPSEGYADIAGRVGSLLEVGTGFHGELTGRENLYLNGAILGMKRKEIDRKFDEIVAFSEIGQFIDTPVKHYSSGMYLRLAFAVAAHLEPEILLIDEVLAVGDANFQKKCLGKMSEVTGEGGTVVFVSHNMAAVLRLCTKGVLLNKGRVEKIGDIQSVVQYYLDQNLAREGEHFFEPKPPSKTPITFLSVRILNAQKRTSSTVNLTEGLWVQINYRVAYPIRGAQVAFSLFNSEGVCVLGSTDFDNNLEMATVLREPGDYVAECHIPSQYLRPGSYSLDLIAAIPNRKFLDTQLQCISFEVFDNGSVDSQIGLIRGGVIAPVLDWTASRLESNPVKQV